MRQVNFARAGLTGVNKQPIPPGQVAVQPNGRLTVSAADGRQFNLRPNGTLASVSAHGVSASYRGNGGLANLHTANLDIIRGPQNQRTIITPRPNNSSLVSTGPRTGYLQRAVVHNGQTYIQRTYVSGDTRYSRLYVPYTFHGVALDSYVPAAYYAPAFYGWVYYPWQSPAAYAWNSTGSTWRAYYGSYFSPSTSYTSGTSWLTDYYLSQTLSAGYQMQVQPNGQEPAPALAASAAAVPGDEVYAQTDTPIDPAIKESIAQEVQQQLSYENAAAVQPDIAPELSDLAQNLQLNHIFVVDRQVNVSTLDQQACGLAAGDVLRVVTVPDEQSTTANLTVVSGRRTDCPAAVVVSVALADLQEMHNNFRAQLDSGLKQLRIDQGHGLPSAPRSAIAPPPRPTADIAADNENVQALLQSQQQEANQAESQATQVALASHP